MPVDECGNSCTYADREGHPGLIAIMGRGLMINVTKNIALVVSVSTEVEVVSNR